MTTRTLTQSFSLALLLTAATAASAQTVRGPNGHFYSLVSAPGITWTAGHILERLLALSIERAAEEIKVTKVKQPKAQRERSAGGLI